MRASRYAVLALLITAAAPLTAAGQSSARLDQRSFAPPRPIDPTIFRARMAAADSLSYLGRLNEARRSYRAIADEQLAAGAYAGDALWHLANSFYGDDDNRAAAVLDELASTAARFGDPTMEINATFESAIIYQRVHQGTRAATRLGRVKELLQSPAISDDAKAAIVARLKTA